MRSYILRRLLLMIPTLIGISLVCFILIQLLPGGPVEELISRAQQAASMKGGVDASMKNVCFPMELEGMSKKDAKKKAKELLDSTEKKP